MLFAWRFAAIDLTGDVLRGRVDCPLQRGVPLRIAAPSLIAMSRALAQASVFDFLDRSGWDV